MHKAGSSTTSRFTEIHWKTLHYFSLYRFCIAILLFASTQFQTAPFSLLTAPKAPGGGSRRRRGEGLPSHRGGDFATGAKRREDGGDGTSPAKSQRWNNSRRCSAS